MSEVCPKGLLKESRIARGICYHDPSVPLSLPKGSSTRRHGKKLQSQDVNGQLRSSVELPL